MVRRRQQHQALRLILADTVMFESHVSDCSETYWHRADWVNEDGQKLLKKRKPYWSPFRWEFLIDA